MRDSWASGCERFSFVRVFTSPLQRASKTCELAGFGAVAEVDRRPDRMGLRPLRGEADQRHPERAARLGAVPRRLPGRRISRGRRRAGRSLHRPGPRHGGRRAGVFQRPHHPHDRGPLERSGAGRRTACSSAAPPAWACSASSTTVATNRSFCDGIVSMAETIEKSLLELDFASLTRRTFTPSPAAWEDQVLYFLLLDRFSDGKEKDGYRDIAGRPVPGGVTPLYRPEDAGRVDYDTWFRAGGGWQGGTLQGLRSKLGYLRRLGITALWVSPPFRQVAFEPSYHGYGIQNFLDVDPHFGTREEFRDFVQAAHEQGIYVILDIVAHHTGNVFSLRRGSLPDARPGVGPVVQRPALGRQALRRPGLQRPRRPADAAVRNGQAAEPPGGGLAGRRDLAARVPAPGAVSPQGAHHQLGLLPRVRRGGHVRPEDARHLGAAGRAVPQASSALACLGLVYWLLDRLRRPRRLPHRRRQAHGRRRRCGPSVT